ncbi:hypothetical protein [Streptosporangium pseudovulgare]|uniref:Uncharacterized protein n=1 Tax=Streptosporangium pseudovulgare TaxID=35765 RepID=A0ABQ2QWZ4_9ACTN|nr:hypothetical protein [Streptosporangium pseudovulgare]GGP97463.1 hypothetical protein GCM10010140_29410 [Streptosporangium pseudovulgare]
MARVPYGRWGAFSPAVRRVPAAVSADGAVFARDDRMARFAAGSRLIVRRVLSIGGLLAAGWLLAVVFGLLGAAPAAADTTAAAGAAGSRAPVPAASGPAVRAGVFPAESGMSSASGDAEAMAGRGVDGLTSQSGPVSPTPAAVDHGSGTDGFLPQGNGGSGPSGPGVGDVARFVYDPRPMARRAPLACVLPPVVRTAADDPSFSPD